MDEDRELTENRKPARASGSRNTVEFGVSVPGGTPATTMKRLLVWERTSRLHGKLDFNVS